MANDGSVLQSKPFSLLDILRNAYAFTAEVVSMFFDSIFASKADVKARIGSHRSSASSTFNSRNSEAAADSARRRNQGGAAGGSNVRGVGDIRASAQACAGGG